VAYRSLVVLANPLRSPLLFRCFARSLLHCSHIQGCKCILCEALSFFEIHELDIEASQALGTRVPSFAAAEAYETRCILWSWRCGCTNKHGRYPGWSRNARSGQHKAQSWRNQRRDSWWGLSEHTGGVQRCWGDPRMCPKCLLAIRFSSHRMLQPYHCCGESSKPSLCEAAMWSSDLSSSLANFRQCVTRIVLPTRHLGHIRGSPNTSEHLQCVPKPHHESRRWFLQLCAVYAAHLAFRDHPGYYHVCWYIRTSKTKGCNGSRMLLLRRRRDSRPQCLRRFDVQFMDFEE